MGLFWTSKVNKVIGGVILDTSKNAFAVPIFCGYDIYVVTSVTSSQNVASGPFEISRFWWGHFGRP